MTTTLINDDCYKAIKNIPDKSVDLVYIDVPYLIYSGCVGNSALSKRIIKINYTDLATIRNGFDLNIFDELCRVMKNIYIYIWCSKEQLLPIMKYFIEEKKCAMNLLCWCKTNPTPATNGVWLPDIEYCLVFKDKNTPKYNDGYELKSKWYISPANKQDKDEYGHPTIKPLELVKRHLKHSCKPGDVVLDCFMGSGTTGVACKMLDLNFIGMEINKEYFEIAEKRINKEQHEQLGLF